MLFCIGAADWACSFCVVIMAVVTGNRHAGDWNLQDWTMTDYNADDEMNDSYH